MRIRLHTILSAVALALCLQGCSAPEVETADSSTAATEAPASRAPVAAGTGSDNQEEEKPAETPPASSGRKRAPVAAGFGGNSDAPPQKTEPAENTGRTRRMPMAAGTGGGATQTLDSSQDNSQPDSSSSQDDSSQNNTPSSSDSNRGRSGPPPGSNYGNSSSSSSNRGRSGPPPGSNYGNTGRPPGIVNPYESGGGSYPGAGNYPGGNNSSGSGSTGTSGPPQERGGNNEPPPSNNTGSSGATMSLEGERNFGGGGDNQSGSSGATMSLDGGPSPAGAPNQGRRNPEPEKAVAVEETSFYNMAMNRFASGEDYAGYQLLQAELIANRDRFDDFPLQFWREAKQPTLGIRMGIGVNYVAVGDFSGKPPVIGDPAPEINRGGGRSSGGPPGGGLRPPSMGGPSGGGRGDNPPSGAKEFLDYYAGDITDAILNQFEERFKGSPARFGNALGSLDVRPVIKVESTNTNRGGSSAASRRNPAGLGSGGSSFQSGQNQNQTSYGFYPGLVFLGEGSPAELEKKAEDQKLDGYILIKQKAQNNRSTGQPTSETKAEFYLAGKRRGDTKTLYYQMVAGKRSQGDTPVEDEVSKLFEKKVDRFCTVLDFPELTEESCVARLDSIMEKSKSDPLPFLMEANFYVHKGWMNEDLAQEKIIALIGEENALNVFSEDFQKQKAGLKKWLPK